MSKVDDKEKSLFKHNRFLTSFQVSKSYFATKVNDFMVAK